MKLIDTLVSWGEKAIGYINTIANGASSLSSVESNAPITSYEPDKLRIAEIERDTQLQLADKEAERIELMTQAKIALIREEGNFQLAIEQARLHGLEQTALMVERMRERVTDVARLRIEIINNATLEVVKDVEAFYATIETKMQQDDRDFDDVRLPALLEKLASFPPDSASHRLFEKRISDLIENQLSSQAQHLEAMYQRQQLVIAGINHTALAITQHSNAMEEKLIDCVVAHQSQHAAHPRDVPLNHIAQPQLAPATSDSQTRGVSDQGARLRLENQ
uniref:hypothetical protein n=1 Tax=Thaumasiovibrio occultus TaxID=1891184 RepID=UPI000B35D90A|nr:hypothetical protein [Thaumasiovibrio occultus]